MKIRPPDGSRRRALFVAPVVLVLFLISETPWAQDGSKPGDSVLWSEPAPLAERSLLLDATLAGSRVVAVGERGHVLLSEGQGWRQVKVPTRSMLTSVAAPGSGSQVWVVGHDAVILHSADGGENWARQYFAPDEQSPLFVVWFENQRHGLAVGAYGLALETSDGGETWRRREIDPEERHLYAITQDARGTLFIAGESGALFGSDDLGKTWRALESPYAGSFFGALATADGGLLIFGLRGNLYRSSDRGQSWARVETGTTASLMSGLQNAAGRVVLVGLGGTILVSDDDGQSFATTNRADRRALTDVIQVPGGALLLLGEGGFAEADLPRGQIRGGSGG